MTVVSLDGVDGVPITTHFGLPIDVPATAAFTVIVHRILGGPAVTGVKLDWISGDGTATSRTYYL